jgi:hypothetical protein
MIVILNKDEIRVGYTPGEIQEINFLEEKYYICPSCGELTTKTQIEREMEYGGMGLCWCEYCDYQWDTTSQSFEPIYFKNYPEYVRISEYLYHELNKQKNTVLRLREFNTIPKGDLL